MSPRFYVIMLLVFMVVVPWLVWYGYDYGNMSFGCGIKSPPEQVVNTSARTDGKALFQANCATCHNPLKDATGPALHYALSGRDSKFLYIFLTSRSKLKNDERIKEWQKKYGGKCLQFPNLTANDANQIEAYAGTYY